jgi:hypothetical protein
MVVALIVLTVLAIRCDAQTVPPELPRVVPSTAMPLQTGAVHVVAAGEDVQAAITEAEPGDVIEFPCAGQTYQGSYTLPNKGASTAWVVFRSACAAQVPEGTRMTPAKAAALHLPRFIAPSGAAVFTTDYGAHHYRFVGLEIAGGYPGGSGNTLFSLGSDAQTTPAQIAHDLVLDRLYMHGTATGVLRRCVALNSASTAIVESTCADAHENGGDSQAILSWTGPGPYLIRNDYLEAGHEVIMFGGGGDPLIVGLVASDITVTHNTITRPVAWLNVWQVKNLFELKSARRVLVEGNEFSDNWMSAQDGSAIVLKSTNQGGSCTWCGTADVTVRWNVVRNVGTAFNLAAHPEASPVVPMARVAITDNLIVGIREGIFAGSGAAFMVQGDLADVGIDRNTVVTTGDIGTLIFKTTGNRTTRFRFTNNLSVAGTNYGIYGDNTGAGLAATSVYAPGSTISGNLFAGMTDRFNLADYGSIYPAGNRFVRTAAELGLTADWPQRVDSAGVDIARLRATLAGGAPVPAPPPIPTISLAQLRAAITAIDRVVGPGGRENAGTKAALAPVAVYLHALLGATP